MNNLKYLLKPENTMSSRSNNSYAGSEIAYDISKVFWIITFIMAIIYFGFLIEGNLIPIFGEISLIVGVFACLCCWISISKKHEEKTKKIYPLHIKTKIKTNSAVVSIV